MSKQKLTFDEALERLVEGRPLKSEEIQSKALDRKVWVAEWHMPGCLSESFMVCTTKADALASALDFMGEETPRGARKALETNGFFQHRTELFGWVNTTVERRRLADLF
jgi:hypothetical protein